jgi:hypothetical protein
MGFVGASVEFRFSDFEFRLSANGPIAQWLDDPMARWPDPR